MLFRSKHNYQRKRPLNGKEEIFLRMRKIVLIICVFCIILSACNIPNGNNEFQLPSVSSEENKADESNAPSQTTVIPEESKMEGSEQPQLDENETAEYSIIDLSSFFGEMTGSAILLDSSGVYQVYNLEGNKKRVSPCSTFKIVAVLAALDLGIITKEESLIEWDGTVWPIRSWNTDMDASAAFSTSCVWYFRKLIDKIGVDNLQDYLGMLSYGNQNITQWEGSGVNGNPLIDGFWLESSLLISPIEQMEVLERIFKGGTDIKPETVEVLKEYMHIADFDGSGELYGKTGTGNGGWFIGFIETNREYTFFAIRLDNQGNGNGAEAKTIAENIIKLNLQI